MSKIRLIAAGAVAAAAAMLALAGPASAHVTVSASGAMRGGSDQEIIFRVPVEKNVDTVGLKIALPTDTPIVGVQVQAIPGWTHTEHTTKLARPVHTNDGDITEAVSQIDWKAKTGAGLKPGEFGAYTIIAGQLPDTAKLTFKVIQVYGDGTSVPWIEVAAPGSTAQPEHPAPVLTLANPPSPSKSSGATSPATPAAAKSSNTGPVVLSIVALVLAAAALGFGIVTRAAGRRT